MKTCEINAMTTVLACGLCLVMTRNQLCADTFGIESNAFTVDFVTVGNPGNANDAGAGGGVYSSPFGGVAYAFRMGIYEISQDQITKATNAGMTNVTADRWTGNQPAANITWFEAAAFVNWLNTSKGYHQAYNLTYSGGTWGMNLWSSEEAWQLGSENLYRHKNAYYFLPSEDEWYKAAYHKNDGVTANFWDYPTASNSIPDGIDSNGDSSYDAVFYDGYTDGTPKAVSNAGSVSSACGTYGQGGNVWEWNESAWDRSNDLPSENRAFRGGYFVEGAGYLCSSYRYIGGIAPAYKDYAFGFRVASIPLDVVLPDGTGLSFNCDTDGDGLNDASEHQLTSLGFNWQVNQSGLVTTLFSNLGGALPNLNGAGLYNASQIQTLNVGTPLLQRNAGTGLFTLKIAVTKSMDLLHFDSFPMTAPQTTINGQGEVEFQFDSPDQAAFFRVQAR